MICILNDYSTDIVYPIEFMLYWVYDDDSKNQLSRIDCLFSFGPLNANWYHESDGKITLL